MARAEGGPYYTISTVSERVGRSPDRIREWMKGNESLRPTHKMPLGETGKSFVWLYTEDDISRLIEYASTRKPGRPPKQET